MRDELSPVLDDQPAQQDYLDFNSYVQALKELIIHDKTKTPLTLGIYGRWGMGKTTLMQMLEKELEKQGMTTIWFNAWQYGNEDELWAAFLQSMLNKIQNSLIALRLPIFKIKLFFRRLKWNDIPKLLISFLIRTIIVILPILIVDPVSQTIAPSARPYLQAGGGLITFLLAIWIVAKPLVETIQKNVSINISDFQKTSNFQEHIAFLDKFREHFADIVHCLPKKGDKRLAVFIDDLDRCSPEQAIQILDAIKLFVDISGCIYILGLDVDVVQKAVVSKYADDPTAQREYMSKIIQIPFQLPPLTRREMQLFLEQLTLELPHPVCREVFVTGLVVNPRELKRTINIFSLLWNLASKRPELIEKIEPVRLAKVVVVQQAFPELHKILQQRPYLLIELEKFFRDEEENMHQTQEVILTMESASEKGNEEKQEDVKKSNLHPELLSFSKNEALRSMLLIVKAAETQTDFEQVWDDYGFSFLKAEDVAIYFTLTNRAEAPKPVAPSQSPFSSTSMPAIGSLLGGRYQIKYEIGRGGMSTIYQAFDVRLQRDVAVKALHLHLISSAPSVEKRFEQEIKMLSGLNHPNLISIFDFGIENGIPYYVMEYLPGGSLKEVLERKKILSEKEVEEILPILDALGYIHENRIVHRDIKPSSILFDGQRKPLLTDLSISKTIMQATDMTNIGAITDSGAIVGTPWYMSPEQSQGKTIDQRSDLYSFGVVLFECLTGKAVYSGDTPLGVLIKHIQEPIPFPRTINPNISSALENVIVKLLSKDPDDRYQTAQETKVALQMALVPSGVEADL